MSDLSPSNPAPSRHDAIATTKNQADDVEQQHQPPLTKEEPSTSSTETAEPFDSGLEDNSKVPKLPLAKLFIFFLYNFGIFAWGGPVAQIALIKQRLVIQDQWITMERFQRVFAVYQ